MNLVDNALRYGQRADLTLRVEEQAVTLQVDDAGSSIPKERRQDVLQPFSRLEPSRSRGTGGAGLGLAIVKTLLDAHEGRLTISDAPNGGARITVDLPPF